MSKGKYIPSMAEIARETGVSLATVSRVMKGSSKISDATKEKVLEASRRLGYSSNLLVKGIHGEGTRTVGISLVNLDEFHSRLLDGMLEALWKRDYAPLLLKPSLRSDEREIMRAFLERRVEGVIMRVYEHKAGQDYFSEMISRGLPLVQIDSKLQGFQSPFSGTDDYWGGWRAAELFSSLGHEVLGHVPGGSFSSTARLRLKGFSDYVAAHPGLSLALCGNESYLPDPKAIGEMLKSKPRPTAVFAANDILARGVYECAAALGLRIPKDLSVLGFGNASFSSLLQPSLSSFEQFPEKVGGNAVEALLEVIGGGLAGELAPETLVKPELLERASVAKL